MLHPLVVYRILSRILTARKIPVQDYILIRQVDRRLARNITVRTLPKENAERVGLHSRVLGGSHRTKSKLPRRPNNVAARLLEGRFCDLSLAEGRVVVRRSEQ